MVYRSVFKTSIGIKVVIGTMENKCAVNTKDAKAQEIFAWSQAEIVDDFHRHFSK
jgi:hypothetical protein